MYLILVELGRRLAQAELDWSGLAGGSPLAQAELALAGLSGFSETKMR